MIFSDSYKLETYYVTEIICFIILVPEGPPTDISGESVNSTAIAINMSPPTREFINGIVLGYEVTYWTAVDPPKILSFTREDTDELVTPVVLSGLREMFNYSITIKAYTKFGLGPSSQVIIIETQEDGMCFAF